MDKPVLTWYTKMGSDKSYSDASTGLYAGTYTGEKPVSINIQLWNNRWGEEDVEDLKDFSIKFSFKDTEDSSLLGFCSVIVNDTDIRELKKTGRHGILSFGEDYYLSGKANDGSSKNSRENFLQMLFTFSTNGELLKEADLKTLYLEIVENI